MRILVIDDDVGVAQVVRRMLHDEELSIETDPIRGVAHAASAELRGEPFELVLCEYSKHQISGLDVQASLRTHLEPPIFVLMSDYDHVVDAAARADAVLIKPLRSEEVRSAIAAVKEARSRTLTRRIRRMRATTVDLGAIGG